MHYGYAVMGTLANLPLLFRRAMEKQMKMGTDPNLGPVPIFNAWG